VGKDVLWLCEYALDQMRNVVDLFMPRFAFTMNDGAHACTRATRISVFLLRIPSCCKLGPVASKVSEPCGLVALGNHDPAGCLDA